MSAGSLFAGLFERLLVRLTEDGTDALRALALEADFGGLRPADFEGLFDLLLVRFVTDGTDALRPLAFVGDFVGLRGAALAGLLDRPRAPLVVSGSDALRALVRAEDLAKLSLTAFAGVFAGVFVGVFAGLFERPLTPFGRDDKDALRDRTFADFFVGLLTGPLATSSGEAFFLIAFETSMDFRIPPRLACRNLKSRSALPSV